MHRFPSYYISNHRKTILSRSLFLSAFLALVIHSHGTIPLARPRIDKSPASLLADRWHSPPCSVCAAFLHSVRSTFATTFPVLFERRLRIFVFAGQGDDRISPSSSQSLRLCRAKGDRTSRASTKRLTFVQGLIKGPHPYPFWLIGGIRFHVELVPHSFVLSETLLPQHSQCFSNVASEPLSLQGNKKIARLNHRQGAFPLLVQGLIKAPPSIWMIGAFRSSGRARTYNPSVNSRMLCH